MANCTGYNGARCLCYVSYGHRPQQLRRLCARLWNARRRLSHAVAGNADPMLGYLTIRFENILESAAARPPGFLGDEEEIGCARVMTNRARCELGAESLRDLSKGGRRHRTFETLGEEGAGRSRSCGTRIRTRLGSRCELPLALKSHPNRRDLRERSASALREARQRCRQRCLLRHLRVRTKASDRDDYLAHTPLVSDLRPGPRLA